MIINSRFFLDPTSRPEVKRHGIQPNITMSSRGRYKTSELILDLGPANERRCYKVTPSLIGRAHT